MHNLKQVDLDMPHRQLIVFCGLSGSGKSSLALDTLYAEGQRRYIESFSAYTRQFLERLEKPAAERIDGIPPAIAVTHKNTSRSSRSTVGTATETSDYLRLLFAKIGQVFCRQCGQEVRRDTPQSVAESLAELPAGTRYLIAFAAEPTAGERGPQWPPCRKRASCARSSAIGWSTWPTSLADASRGAQARRRVCAVVDRLAAGSASRQRLRDSLETAFAKGRGTRRRVCRASRRRQPRRLAPAAIAFELDGAPWRQSVFSNELACEHCGLDYPEPEPRLFSFNSPLGACPECEGFGNVIDVDMDLVVPDANKSLREGAIAPWNTPAYAHELQELLALADDYDLPVECRIASLPSAAAADHRRRARAKVRRARTAFSPGSSGASTRCTCACFSAAGAAIGPVRPAAARGCGPRRWPCASAATTSPKFRG